MLNTSVLRTSLSIDRTSRICTNLVHVSEGYFYTWFKQQLPIHIVVTILGWSKCNRLTPTLRWFSIKISYVFQMFMLHAYSCSVYMHKEFYIFFVLHYMSNYCMIYDMFKHYCQKASQHLECLFYINYVLRTVYYVK